MILWDNYKVKYNLFFFSSRRRHTRLQGDWSSDVCSSDLVSSYAPVVLGDGSIVVDTMEGIARVAPNGNKHWLSSVKIGRASCRERVEVAEDDGSARKKRMN